MKSRKEIVEQAMQKQYRHYIIFSNDKAVQAKGTPISAAEVEKHRRAGALVIDNGSGAQAVLMDAKDFAAKDFLTE